MINWTFNHLSGFFPRPSSTRTLPHDAKNASPRRNPAQYLQTILTSPSAAPRRFETCFRSFQAGSGSRRDALLIGEINEYLSQASNVTDLEQRIRVIEQQRHFS